MASKSAVLKLLEEKYLVKKKELDSLRITQTKELYKQRDERQNEIYNYIKSQVITLSVPCVSTGKKKPSATFQADIVIEGFGWRFNAKEGVYAKDPTYSHLTSLIDDIENVAQESLNQLYKEYKAIRESVILTGVPENIKELLSKFEGV